MLGSGLREAPPKGTAGEGGRRTDRRSHVEVVRENSAPGPLTAKWDFTGACPERRRRDGDGTRTGQSYTPYTNGTAGTPVITRYYFGGAYETAGTTWKKYYSFGGQTVMRDASGFKYFLTDQLGSVSVVLSATGTILEQQRYLPFGGVRTDLSNPPYRITSTDFTYTGQRNLPDTGLMDYRARFYSPALGRFIQPDSIIPGAANSQSWNRYSYVLNNPIMLNDPTGHKYCDGEGDDDCSQYSNSVEHQLRKNRVKVNKKWKDHDDELLAVLTAIELVGTQFASVRGLGETSDEAFRAVYGLNDGEMFYFEWDENCWGCREDPKGCDAGTTTGDACTSAFGYTNGENWIEFASMSSVETPLRNVNNVIHELGHAFNMRLARAPENALALRPNLLVNGAGFYGYPGNMTWEQSTGTNASETFADQFLGWVYGRWGADPLGPVRAEFMTQMNGTNGWVTQAAALP